MENNPPLVITNPLYIGNHTQINNILKNPENFLGPFEKDRKKIWVFDDEKLVCKPVTFSYALVRVFDEILLNAADSYQRDPTTMDLLEVEIDTKLNTISVCNQGSGLPVIKYRDKHGEELYAPEKIFSDFFASGVKNRTTTSAVYGFGAKLVNIFSSELTIETTDGGRRQKYKQVFQQNMKKKSAPIITDLQENENWTKVTFKPDLKKFKMTCLEEDVVSVMKKRVLDMAGCLPKTVSVKLNNVLLRIKSFKDYAKHYIKSDKPMFHDKVGDRWEFCVSLSDDGQFHQVSFVNCIATIKGGTHVDYITNQITTYLADKVNRKIKNANLTANQVKNFLWVFVNAIIDCPSFDSQTKETLTTRQASFGSECVVPESVLKKVAKSDIMTTLQSWVKDKLSGDLPVNIVRTKAREIYKIQNLEDAHEAGRNNSKDCTLILTEGDSAMSLAMCCMQIVGQDKYGVFPLRGKLPSRWNTHQQISKYKELENLVTILGLEEHREYSKVDELRYGRLLIMADPDLDGLHFTGLIINFFFKFWPSLLKVEGFMARFSTPIIQASDSYGKALSFYNMHSYKKWTESLENDETSWNIIYLKGLASIAPADGMKYFKDIEKHIVYFFWAGEQDRIAIQNAFSKEGAEKRREWISEHKACSSCHNGNKPISYRDFIDHDLILFSDATVGRSIPSLVDGLKPGQRKILYASLKRNLFNEITLNQLIGFVSEQSAYHHDEQCLAHTIIRMAHTFVGSNNVNLFEPKGQFGTRNSGGDDHGKIRYLRTKLNPISRYLFPRIDDEVLDYLKEGGKSIEPARYYPIIPWVLVNGTKGIGTGWSSNIPNYNPRDIISNVKKLLRKQKMVPMDPWYKGFRGTIAKASKEEGTYVVEGKVKDIDLETIKITELPIGKWTRSYKKFLESITKGSPTNIKDPLIEDFRQNRGYGTVKIRVMMKRGKKALVMQKGGKDGLLKKFDLISTISTKNMTLFNAKGEVKKYKTAEQIVNEFFPERLGCYEKRKAHMLANLGKLIERVVNLIEFVTSGDVGEGTMLNCCTGAQLLKEMEVRAITSMPSGSKSTELQAVVEKLDDCNFLKSLGARTMSNQDAEKFLLALKRELEKELTDLKNKDATSMWMTDLAELEKTYMM